jgi:hypothetical protein
MPRSSDEETLDPEREQNDQRQKNEDDGGESGKKGGPQGGGGSIGFWNKELKAVRLNVFKNWAMTSTCF